MTWILNSNRQPSQQGSMSDKVINELNTPWGAVNWERNYMNRYVQKNYETNSVCSLLVHSFDRAERLNVIN